MRVLFTSDWQLGAGTALGSGDHGPGSRFQDQVDILDRIVDLAIKEKVSLFACLGDVFERSRPNPSEILAVQAVVRRLLSHNIRCLFIAGNHDSRGAALPTALEIFAGTGCVVSLLPSIFPFEAIDPDDPTFVIATLPWVPPGSIVSAMPDVARDDINDMAAQGLVGGARVLAERCKTEYPDAKSILVGHWAVSGAALPTGLDTAMLREPVIPLEGLTGAGFDLVAFGHIHAGQVLATTPTPVFYAGSPQVNSWGEVEGEHGVWIYDSAERGLRFHPIADNKRFVTSNIDATVEDDYSRFDVEGAVVRVNITGTATELRAFDMAALRATLIAGGAVKVLLKPNQIAVARARLSEIASDTLDESGALDLWLSSQMIAEPLAGRMREAHGAYLEVVRG